MLVAPAGKDILPMQQQQQHEPHQGDTSESSSVENEATSAAAAKKPWKKPPNPSFLTVLKDSMNPQACLNAYYGGVNDEEYCSQSGELVPFDERLDKVLPDILTGIRSDQEEHRVHCLEELLVFVDSEHIHNRIPLVCSRRWNIIQELTTCLKDPTTDAASRKLICSILNDLSIPYDNKAVLVLGPQKDMLLSSLLHVIQQYYPESCYLSCACLMNLSILEDSKSVLMHYELPNSSELSSATKSKESSLDNPSSLLRLFQSMMSTYIPLLTTTSTDVVSVESLAVRYATGFFRNLATVDEHAMLIAETDIPLLLSQYLAAAFQIKPLCKWTEDSLEDLALSLLGMLVRVPETRTHLERHHDAEMKANLQEIANDGEGIHSMRASVIIQSLGGAAEI